MDAVKQAPRTRKPKPLVVAPIQPEWNDEKLEPVELSLSYQVNDKGKRTHVVMPMADFDALIERMELLLDSLAAVRALSRPNEGKSMPWEEVKAKMKREGKL